MALVRLTPVVALLAALAMPPSPPTWSKSTVTNILTFYGAGDYAGAIEAIESVAELPVAGPLPGLAAGPDSALEDWQHGANDWIRLAVWPSGTRRRQMIAATVALEILHARPELTGYRRLSFLSWACAIVRDHPTGSDDERLWYLTSVAVLQEFSSFGLLPVRNGDMSLRLVHQSTDRAELMTGHLAHARTAIPQEGRFRLAEVLARAALTSVTTFSASRNWLDANELPVKHPPTNRDQLKDLTDRLATLPAIERDLTALANHEELRAEVELNLGDLSARQQRWDDALAHLDRVVPFTHEAFLIAIDHYLRGWVLQRMDRRADAIAEYRLALDASPGARSISTMLADQLAQDGRQAEAYEILDAALKASAAQADSHPRALAGSGRGSAVFLTAPSNDPWSQFQRGDARLIPAYFTQLRKALR